MGTGGDDGGAAAPTERVLEDACEFGVAVGHVVCSSTQCRHHVAQARQRQIDLLCLLQVHAPHSTLPDLLASRKVDEAQLRPILPLVTAVETVEEEDGV